MNDANMIRVLVTDDEEDFRESVAEFLRESFEVRTAANGDQAVGHVARDRFDVVLLDLKMPGRPGMDVLRELKGMDDGPEVIVVTAHGSVDAAVEAMRLGAYDFVTKPCHLGALAALIEKATEKRNLLQTNARLVEHRRRTQRYPEIVGESDEIQRLKDLIDRIAPSSSPVLIQGESGTGKELVANAIHRHSPRADEPFIVVNCAALQENLLENELFGHVRGAFTGAISRKRGLVEVADGGSLFIDEIAEMTTSAQTKLLRVLDNGQYTPLGDTTNRRVDVRLIAATNRRLEDEVEAERFREDLFYRLNVFAITVSPLRRRRGDIPLLVEHFLSQLGLAGVKRVSDRAMQALVNYHWRGNVRELSNLVERAAILSESKLIVEEDFPLDVRRASIETIKDRNFMTLEEVEREHIERILALCNGNKLQTAKTLGIDRRTLYRKMQRYALI